MSDIPYDKLYCDVCNTHHNDVSTVDSHERAASIAEDKYGISI